MYYCCDIKNTSLYLILLHNLTVKQKKNTNIKLYSHRSVIPRVLSFARFRAESEHSELFIAHLQTWVQV